MPLKSLVFHHIHRFFPDSGGLYRVVIFIENEAFEQGFSLRHVFSFRS
jgi:hypothetical protein